MLRTNFQNSNNYIEIICYQYTVQIQVIQDKHGLVLVEIKT